MRFLSPLLFAFVSCFALIGARTNWFANGFGLREINMLERDWLELSNWLELYPPPRGSDFALPELRLRWKVAEKFDELPEPQKEGWIERDQLAPRTGEMIERFQLLIATGQLNELPITGTCTPLRQLARLELRLDDLSSQRMEHFLTWTQNLQRGVSPVGKDMGIDLGILALQRCQEDPRLTPWKRPLPPPR